MQKIDCERQEDSKEKGSEELVINEFVKPNLTPEAIIGHGTFGYVFKAFDNNRNCTVAVKRTHKVGDVISREYEILKRLEGEPNIV
jgi:predicted Ser/Thr protein kinase